MSALIIGVIVALGTILSPLMLAYLTGRQRHAEAIEGWAREDVVAARAQKASDDLLARQDVLAAKADETKAVLVDSAAKLDQIHVLVNSNLTAAIEATLEATKAQLVMLKAKNGEGTPVVQSAIASVEAKVAALEQTLAERAEQTKIGEAQVATTKGDT